MNDQGTDAWLGDRCGKVTASALAKVMAKTKSGWGADRKNYRAQIIAERLTGYPQGGSFTNAAMQWGTDTEPQARAMYEMETGQSVTETGFVPHPTIEWSGASPDGLVGTDGLVEIKCPNTATHLETLDGANIDRKYVYQMQWQMVCTGRQWCDFASFDPRLPLPMQLHVQRVDRDDELLAELEAEVVAFLDDVEMAVASLNNQYMKEAA